MLLFCDRCKRIFYFYWFILCDLVLKTFAANQTFYASHFLSSNIYEDQTGHYKSTWVQKRFVLSYTAKNDAELDMTSFVFYQTYLLFILALFLRNINNMLLHLQNKVKMCQVSRLKRKMMRYHFTLQQRLHQVGRIKDSEEFIDLWYDIYTSNLENGEGKAWKNISFTSQTRKIHCILLHIL